MSAHVIPAYSVDVHRDIRDGVDIAESIERRMPPEAKARFIEAMRADVANAPPGIGREAMREGFEAMGLPPSWIDEVLA